MNEFIKAFQNYANFTGRATRKEYWLFALWNAVVLGLLIVPMFLVDSLFFLPFVYFLAMIVPACALSARRLHDTGRSGLLLLLSLLGVFPFVGLISQALLIIWFAADSQTGTNIWGPNPKETHPSND